MAYVIALDQGTTSSRSVVFDERGRVVAKAQREFAQHFPKPGWVEHEPGDLWDTQLATLREAVTQAGIEASQIAALGVTNQRETTLLWDRRTGEPVHRAIVWQDRRTAAFCETLAEQGHAKTIQQKTGLVIDAYFSASKVRWLLDHVDGARALAEAGHLAFGTVDSWLIWNLTGGRVHVTDATNASRTMLFNTRSMAWDEELLAMFDVPASVLPQVRSSSEVYGEMDASVLGEAVPIAGIAGDQQAALFGQMCTRPGMAKNTYGTGCFVLQHTGDQPVPSNNRLLDTVALQRDGETTYALEGSVFIGGALVQWLRDGLSLIKHSSEIEALASQVADTDGVYLVPAFAGLGAPYWDAQARGTIVGLTRGTSAAHLARASLEAIAFQVGDVLRAMGDDAGSALTELRVDGGAAVNDLLMQFQADVLRVPVVRPTVIETTAAGAAYLAGLAVGVWSGADEIAEFWQVDRVFEPAMDADEAAAKVSRWREALERSRGWAEE